MKKRMFVPFAALLLLALFGCQSSGEQRQEYVNACSALCKNHPEVKEMTVDEGGASLLFLGGGYSKRTCTCNRKGG